MGFGGLPPGRKDHGVYLLVLERVHRADVCLCPAGQAKFGAGEMAERFGHRAERRNDVQFLHSLLSRSWVDGLGDQLSLFANPVFADS